MFVGTACGSNDCSTDIPEVEYGEGVLPLRATGKPGIPVLLFDAFRDAGMVFKEETDIF